MMQICLRNMRGGGGGGEGGGGGGEGGSRGGGGLEGLSMQEPMGMMDRELEKEVMLVRKLSFET